MLRSVLGGHGQGMFRAPTGRIAHGLAPGLLRSSWNEATDFQAFSRIGQTYEIVGSQEWKHIRYVMNSYLRALDCCTGIAGVHFPEPFFGLESLHTRFYRHAMAAQWIAVFKECKLSKRIR